MMKNVKNVKVLYQVLPFHYDVKMTFLHFLTFQRTESRDQVICLMLDWHKHPEHVCCLSFENVFFRWRHRLNLASTSD